MSGATTSLRSPSSTATSPSSWASSRRASPWALAKSSTRVWMLWLARRNWARSTAASRAWAVPSGAKAVTTAFCFTLRRTSLEAFDSV